MKHMWISIKTLLSVYDKEMILYNLFPAIRIHVWGGLGSQLYAVALSIDIKLKFPSRRIRFITHSGGVTRRTLEPSLFHGNVKFRDDYTNNYKESSRVTNQTRGAKSIIKNILFKAGLFSDANNEKSIESMKPWVIIIRGHYSNRDLSHSTVLKLWRNVEKDFKSNQHEIQQDFLAVHYRLGDLQFLPNKSPIKQEKIQDVVAKTLKKNRIGNLYLYSDSIQIATTRLKNLIPQLSVIPRDLTPLETVYECVQSSIFIGTNSKLSVWIILFKIAKDSKGQCFLPTEIKHLLKSNSTLLSGKKIILF